MIETLERAVMLTFDTGQSVIVTLAHGGAILISDRVDEYAVDIQTFADTFELGINDHNLIDEMTLDLVD